MRSDEPFLVEIGWIFSLTFRVCMVAMAYDGLLYWLIRQFVFSQFTLQGQVYGNKLYVCWSMQYFPLH